MKSKNAKSKTAPKQKLGFLLTLTLVWLCMFTLGQAIGLLSGLAVLIAAFQGEVSLLTGIGFFLLGVALLAIGVLAIVFLFKGHRAFFVALVLCELSLILKQFLSNPIDLPAIEALIIFLLLVAGYWILLFVSDNVRKRFGLPILHPRKKKPENTWS